MHVTVYHEIIYKYKSNIPLNNISIEKTVQNITFCWSVKTARALKVNKHFLKAQKSVLYLMKQKGIILLGR